MKDILELVYHTIDDGVVFKELPSSQIDRVCHSFIRENVYRRNNVHTIGIIISEFTRKVN